MPRVPHTSSGPLEGSMCPPLICPSRVPSTRNVLTRGQLLGCGKGLVVSGDIWEDHVLDGATRSEFGNGLSLMCVEDPLPRWPWYFCWTLRSALLIRIYKHLNISWWPTTQVSSENHLKKGKVHLTALIDWVVSLRENVSSPIVFEWSTALLIWASAWLLKVVFSFPGFFHRSSQAETLIMVPSMGQPWSFPVTCCSNNSGWRVPSQIQFFCWKMKVGSLGMGALIRQEKSQWCYSIYRTCQKQNLSIMTPPWRTFPPNLPTSAIVSSSQKTSS